MPAVAMPFSLTLPAPPTGAGGGQTRSRERSDPQLFFRAASPPDERFGAERPGRRAGRPPNPGRKARPMTSGPCNRHDAYPRHDGCRERVGTGWKDDRHPSSRRRRPEADSVRVSGSCPRPKHEWNERLYGHGDRRCSVGIVYDRRRRDRPRAGQRPGLSSDVAGIAFNVGRRGGRGADLRLGGRGGRVVVGDELGLGRGHEARGTEARCPIGGAGAERRPAGPSHAVCTPCLVMAGRWALAGWVRSVGSVRSASRAVESVGSVGRGGAAGPGRRLDRRDGGRPGPAGEPPVGRGSVSRARGYGGTRPRPSAGGHEAGGTGAGTPPLGWGRGARRPARVGAADDGQAMARGPDGGRGRGGSGRVV